MSKKKHILASDALCEQLCLALLSCPTINAAAARVGITRVTAWRIMSSDDFATQMQAIRGQVLQGALAALTARATEAVSALARVIDDPTAPAAARVAAARAILEYALRLEEKIGTPAAGWPHVRLPDAAEVLQLEAQGKKEKTQGGTPC